MLSYFRCQPVGRAQASAIELQETTNDGRRSNSQRMVRTCYIRVGQLTVLVVMRRPNRTEPNTKINIITERTVSTNIDVAVVIIIPELLIVLGCGLGWDVGTNLHGSYLLH